ncbi:MAG: hypothetical protein RMJ29_08600 [Candidatus Bipolaricaulota bacterium]|nr:hypothetical protein [Candidatus Bipolaricaulota bacterium]
MMFDLEGLKRSSGLSAEQLEVLEAQVRAELGRDELMVELHLLRVLEAVRRGWITVSEALGVEAKAS